MPESESHKRLKRKAAGKKGQTEKKISGEKRLDAQKRRKAIEIERSGTKQGISNALDRLKTQVASRKELDVPQRDLDKAKEIARKKNMNVTIQNLSKTRRRFVKKKT